MPTGRPALIPGGGLTLVALFAAACASDLAVPAGAQLTCTANSQCPQGFVCSPALQRCVAVAELDPVAPALDGAPVVAPRVGARGTVFRVSFRATKPLAEDPEVWVQARPGSAEPPRPLALESREAQAYAYAYTASGDEAEGAAPVVIRLVDLSGNVADGLGGASLAFDFTPPELRGPSVTPPLAAAGTTVLAQFSASEPVAAAQVHVGDFGQAAPSAVQPGDGSTVFEYTPLATDPEGDAALTAELRDEAGNKSRPLTVGTVRLDFSAPWLLVPPASETQLLKRGDVASVQLAFSEPLAGAEKVRLVPEGGGEALTDVKRAVSGAVLTFLRVVQDGEDGRWSMELSGVRDAAGNEADTEVVGQLLVDTVVPQIVGGAPSLVGPAWLREGAEVRAVFTTSEPVSPPAVDLRMASHPPLPLVLEEESSDPSGPGTRYVYRHAVLAGDPEGSAQIAVAIIADRADNRSGPWTAGPIEIDRTPPFLDPQDMTVTPASPVGLFRNLVITVSAAEILAGASLETEPALPMGPAIVSVLTASWGHVVSGSDPSGPFRATVWVEDLAGNSDSLVVDAAGWLDTTTPEVTSSAVGPSPAKVGTVITLTFDTSEALTDLLPAARVGEVAMDLAPGSTATHFVFTHTAQDAESSGAKPVRVALADAAGNSATATLGQVTYDFAAPALTRAGVSVSPSPAGIGQVVAVRVTAPELLLDADPLLVRSPPGISFGPATIAGATATWTHAVAEGETSDPAPLDLTLTVRDLAQNPSTLLVDAAGVIDGMAPAVVPGSGVLPAAPLRNGDRVEVRFTASETVLDPGVRVGALPLLKDAASAPPAYVYAAAVNEATQDEGTFGVLVTLEDLSGNTSVSALSQGLATAVTFDFSLPSIVADSYAVILEAGSDNPLPEVSAVGVGTAVRVSFTVDEPLRSIPLVYTLPPERLDFSLLSAAGTTYTYRLPPLAAGAHSQGWHALAVAITDLAGNGSSDLLLGGLGFVVDTVPPPVPGVEVEDLILYRRVPWGSNATGGVSRFTVEGAAGAIEALANVFVYDGPSVAVASLLATAPADALGGFGRSPQAAVRLNGGDRRSVYVTAVDGAGNQSDADSTVPGVQAARVLDGEWTASLAGKVVGSTLENPHALALTSLHGASLVPDPRSVVPVDDATVARAALQDGSLAVATGAPTWRQQQLRGDSPEARSYTALAYDSARGRTVLFGGNGAGKLQDTWEWDGTVWRDATPLTGSPPKRREHAMAYDAARGRVVLFGGWGADTYSDTWEWDGESWVDVTPSSGNPDARYAHGMVYDSARGRVIMFGGNGTTQNLNDTWEWDGRAWTQRAPSASPPGRSSFGFAFDSGRGRAVLFGGYWNSPGEATDTWEWDGASWSQRITATRPTGRSYLAMVYDGSSTVLFGGDDNAAGYLQDTWKWNGTTWTQVCTSAPCNQLLPPKRGLHALAHDSARGQVVVFGGYTSGKTFGDTWEYSGSRWAERTPSVTIPPSAGKVAYDEARGRLVMVGNDIVWEWNGARWDQKCGPCSPPAEDGTLAFDGAVNHAVMFSGGSSFSPNDQTWEWDGSTWTQECTSAPCSTSPRPSGRFGASMAYDSTRKKLVLFGGLLSGGPGTYYRETWERDSVSDSWKQLCTDACTASRPQGRMIAAMAYDPVRKKMVLFGGRVLGSIDVQDTWEYDGASNRWTEKCTTAPCVNNRPSARENASMFYDAARGRMVMCDRSLWDLWEWDGSVWHQRPLAGETPTALNGARAFFDTALGQAVAMTQTERQIWKLYNSFALKPAAMATFAWSAAQEPAESVRGLTLETRAGARGYSSTTAAPSDSVALDAWDGWAGGWTTLTTESYGPSAPTAFTDVSTAAQAGRYLLGGRDLTLLVRPAAGQGIADLAPEVDLDAIEVRVAYREGVGAAWEFNLGTAEGWTTSSASSVSAGTWRITPSPGVQLLGPATWIDAGSFKKVRLRLSNLNADTSAELHWQRADQTTWTPAKSQSFTLASDTAFHVYQIDLSNRAEWSGRITRLRIDPVQAGSSFVYLDWVHAVR